MDRDQLLQLIDQAAREEWTELDLSNQKLTDLPPEIGCLTTLEKLDLGGELHGNERNQLRLLPPEIGRLRALTYLNLRCNDLTTIPHEIGQLTALNSLSIDRNRLTALPPEIGQLTVLSSLSLGNNHLTTLPSEIIQLTALTSLGLKFNQLTAVSPEICRLTALTSLDLSYNQLKALCPEISQLTNLTILNLSGNDLTILPPDIGQLANLVTLNLSSNHLSEVPSEIGHLVTLASLDLSYNQLTSLPPEIGQLIDLTHLYLRSNQLKNLPSEISQLTILAYLDLRENQLSTLPPEIGQLTTLTHLDLRENQLSILPPEIGQLTALNHLWLGENQLKTILPEIGQLTALTSLSLYETQLKNLPPEIGQLTALTDLDLGNNQLTSLPPEMAQLEALTSLSLGINQLTYLFPKISQLTALTYLNINCNKMANIPTEIMKLAHLTSLDLRYNQLTALPHEIGQLTALTSLQLSNNQLTALPPEIGQLTNLTSLKLDHNPLTALPREVTHLTCLRTIDVSHTHLPLSPEILNKTYAPFDFLLETHRPQTLILAWLDYLDGNSRPLNETKLILVGEGCVGKTSLVNRLLYDTFDPNSEKTEGIVVHQWKVSGQPSAVSNQITDTGGSEVEKQPFEICVNVWDFGGQESMHATHQFFLTKRTLYVLVLDNRYNEAENRVDYWLTLIRSFGGDSPVLVVGNKSDQDALDIDRRGLLAAHPTVEAIFETSCATGEGIPTLREAITTRIANLPHVSDPIITTWFEVKAELEALDGDYIPYRRYVELCREKSVDNPDSQRVLLGFLHDLGVVLHFPDPRLEATNILNPEWVTKGVYRILNTRLPFDEQGILTWEMLARILDDEPYQEKRMFIVDMMQKFELCYELPDRKHTYLIPDLLPKEAQDTGGWEDALCFEVHYSVLPGSILTRLIVRMHRHIKDQTVWRTGVLLACEGNEALVRADLNANRIRIHVRGPEHGRRDLLTRIREHLGAIHSSLEGLEVAEKVPVPGHPEIPPVDYRWLRECERRGLQDVMPEGVFTPLNVSRLLNGVEPPGARQGQRKRIVYNVDARGSQIGGIGDGHQVEDSIHFNHSSEES